MKKIIDKIIAAVFVLGLSFALWYYTDREDFDRVMSMKNDIDINIKMAETDKKEENKKPDKEINDTNAIKKTNKNLGNILTIKQKQVELPMNVFDFIDMFKSVNEHNFYFNSEGLSTTILNINGKTLKTYIDETKYPDERQSVKGFDFENSTLKDIILPYNILLTDNIDTAFKKIETEDKEIITTEDLKIIKYRYKRKPMEIAFKDNKIKGVIFNGQNYRRFYEDKEYSQISAYGIGFNTNDTNTKITDLFGFNRADWKHTEDELSDVSKKALDFTFVSYDAEKVPVYQKGDESSFIFTPEGYLKAVAFKQGTEVSLAIPGKDTIKLPIEKLKLLEELNKNSILYKLEDGKVYFNINSRTGVVFDDDVVLIYKKKFEDKEEKMEEKNNNSDDWFWHWWTMNHLLLNN